MTKPSIMRAINNLQRHNKNISDAVEARSELDLRIGAAFTRFQTTRFQKVFPNLGQINQLFSYGSCQFPTLGKYPLESSCFIGLYSKNKEF